MADLGEEFDPGSVEPRDSIDPVPAGQYLVEVVESDVVDLKSGKGRAVKLTLQVIDGPFNGRRIWEQINFRHESDVTQKIGQQHLAELCSACGVRGPLQDTEHLHGSPIVARIAVEQDKSGQYGPRNVVKRYSPVGGAGEAPSRAAPRPVPAPRTQTPPPPPVQRQPAAAGAMPWRR